MVGICVVVRNNEVLDKDGIMGIGVKELYLYFIDFGCFFFFFGAEKLWFVF